MKLGLTFESLAAVVGLAGAGPGHVGTPGEFWLTDVAKAAGVGRREAKRALNAYVAGHPEEGRAGKEGAVLTIERSDFPDGVEITRSAVGEIIARRIGLGRFAVRPVRPAPEPKKRKVTVMQHAWREERGGRSVRSVEGGGLMAKACCQTEGCNTTEEIRFRQLPGPSEIEAKFIQKGWSFDRTHCPEHNRRHHPRKDPTMATQPLRTSPAAIAAQAKMFGLLQQHFDADTGTYAPGWSDGKIAEQTGLAHDLVTGVRAEAFGELKEPPEVAQLAADIATVEALLTEQENATRGTREMVEGLKIKLAEVRRKFAA